MNVDDKVASLATMTAARRGENSVGGIPRIQRLGTSCGWVPQQRGAALGRGSIKRSGDTHLGVMARWAASALKDVTAHGQQEVGGGEATIGGPPRFRVSIIPKALDMPLMLSVAVSLPGPAHLPSLPGLFMLLTVCKHNITVPQSTCSWYSLKGLLQRYLSCDVCSFDRLTQQM